MTATVRAPIETDCVTEKDPEFYRKSMLVKTKRGLQVMTMRKLRAAVLAGKADSWMVCDADENGVVHRIICPYCATGFKHRGALH
jgi:hypothetical protein